MLSDYHLTQLWTQLSGKVWVKSIGPNPQSEPNEYTLVTLEKGTSPETIATLPKKFANEKVGYKLETVPDCGQPGHVCVCGTTPKP